MQWRTKLFGRIYSFLFSDLLYKEDFLEEALLKKKILQEGLLNIFFLIPSAPDHSWSPTLKQAWEQGAFCTLSFKAKDVKSMWKTYLCQLVAISYWSKRPSNHSKYVIQCTLSIWFKMIIAHWLCTIVFCMESHLGHTHMIMFLWKCIGKKQHQKLPLIQLQCVHLFYGIVFFK